MSAVVSSPAAVVEADGTPQPRHTHRRHHRRHEQHAHRDRVTDKKSRKVSHHAAAVEADVRVGRPAGVAPPRPPSRPPSRTWPRLSTGNSARTAPLAPSSRGPGSARHLDASSSTSYIAPVSPLLKDTEARGEREQRNCTPSDDTKEVAPARAEKTKVKRVHKSRGEPTEPDVVGLCAPTPVQAPVDTASVEQRPQPEPQSQTRHEMGARADVAEREGSHFEPLPPPLPRSPASWYGEREDASQHAKEEPCRHIRPPPPSPPQPQPALSRTPLPPRVRLVLVLCGCQATTPRDEWASENEEEGPLPVDEVQVPGVDVATTAIGAVLLRLDAYMNGFFSQRASDMVKACRRGAARNHAVVTVEGPPLFFFFPDDNDDVVLDAARACVRGVAPTPLFASSVLADLFDVSDTVHRRQSASHLPRQNEVDDEVEVVLRWYADASESAPHGDAVESEVPPPALPSQEAQHAQDRENEQPPRTTQADTSVSWQRHILAPPTTALAPAADALLFSSSSSPRSPDWLAGAVNAAGDDDSDWPLSHTEEFSASEEEIEVVVDEDEDDDVSDDHAENAEGGGRALFSQRATWASMWS